MRVARCRVAVSQEIPGPRDELAPILHRRIFQNNQGTKTMPTIKSVLLVAATLAALSEAAFAGGADAKVTVTPLPSPASFSGVRTFTAAYNVEVKNVSGDDTIKVLSLKGKTVVTSVVSGNTVNTGLQAVFDPTGSAPFCTAPVVPTEIVCDLTGVPGALIGPTSPPFNFVVSFTTPIRTTSDPALVDPKIKFATRTKYLEYESGEYLTEESYEYEDSETISKTAYTLLDVPDGTKASGYLANGGTFGTSTGATSAATAPDFQTTQYNFPTGQVATAVTTRESTTLTLGEPYNSTLCTSALFTLNKCFLIRTRFTDGVAFGAPFVLGQFEIFKGELAGAVTYASKSYYKPKPPSIGNAVVEYQHVEPGGSTPATATLVVPKCSTDKYGNLKVGPGYVKPVAGLPCELSRKVLSNGNWLFKILQVDNGRVGIR